jgi:hypothetical protein
VTRPAWVLFAVVIALQLSQSADDSPEQLGVWGQPASRPGRDVPGVSWLAFRQPVSRWRADRQLRPDHLAAAVGVGSPALHQVLHDGKTRPPSTSNPACPATGSPGPAFQTAMTMQVSSPRR